MGANYSFYVKTIETHARAFFKIIIFSIGSVFLDQCVTWAAKSSLCEYVRSLLTLNGHPMRTFYKQSTYLFHAESNHNLTTHILSQSAFSALRM